MIDMASERLITLNEAARLRPPSRRGRPTHSSTVYRWISRGVRGQKLEAIRLGGTLYTSQEAMQRFARALTDCANRTTACAPSQVVASELDRLGIA
jgi:hypothetical protein